MTAADALARIDGLLSRLESEQAMWDLGYLAGHADGNAFANREFERIEQERQLWLGVAKSTLALPVQDELARRRQVNHDPCPAKCRRCSRCIHSLAYWARGGRDYLGVEREAELAGDAA